MSQTFTDPASGRPYTVDPVTGQSRWLDQPPAQPSAPAFPPGPGGGWGAPTPTQPPKRGGKGKKILIGAGAVVGVLIVGSALSSGSDGTVTTTTSGQPAASGAAKAADAPSKPAAPKAASDPKIGTAVRDGKFEFTVTGMKTTKKIGTNEYLTKTAQGQFILVSVTVRNIGDEARMFDASSQKLHDTKAREYSASSEAVMYLGDDAKSFLEQINPGNSIKGIVTFDVPAGTALDRIELHDSAFSRGVEVKLTK